MESLTLLPQYKTCSFCQNLLFLSNILNDTMDFICDSCHKVTKWNEHTILGSVKIPISTAEKLLQLFLDNKTACEADKILKYSFVNEGINIKTVYRYFEIFNIIVFDYVNSKMTSTMFDGEVEIDETYLIKEKKSHAPHLSYKNSSQWIFGLRKRGTSHFIITPVEERDRGTLEALILKHIKICSRVYSDCYSVYVNNRTTPKKSHLIKYGYTHYFVNHKVEFVSAVLSTIHTNTIGRK